MKAEEAFAKMNAVPNKDRLEMSDYLWTQLDDETEMRRYISMIEEASRELEHKLAEV